MFLPKIYACSLTFLCKNQFQDDYIDFWHKKINLYITENDQFLNTLNEVILQVINYSFRNLIWMQKSTKFHLPHYQISQLSSQ